MCQHMRLAGVDRSVLLSRSLVIRKRKPRTNNTARLGPALPGRSLQWRSGRPLQLSPSTETTRGPQFRGEFAPRTSPHMIRVTPRSLVEPSCDRGGGVCIRPVFVWRGLHGTRWLTRGVNPPSAETPENPPPYPAGPPAATRSVSLDPRLADPRRRMPYPPAPTAIHLSTSKTATCAPPPRS